MSGERDWSRREPVAALIVDDHCGGDYSGRTVAGAYSAKAVLAWATQ